MLYIIGNWKSHQTITQTKEWFLSYSAQAKKSLDTKIVICGPFTCLPEINKQISQLHLHLESGAQDVSQFQEGKHTGEINAQMLSELTRYCLVGHSERRLEGNETSAQVSSKCRHLLDHQITPIVCVDIPDLDNQISSLHHQQIPIDSILIAFEPSSAIGSGKVEDKSQILNAISRITFLVGDQTPILYGGSVDSSNIKDLVNYPKLSGVLVGGASLDPVEFANITNQVNQ